MTTLDCEPMSELEQTESAIQASLAMIRLHWSGLLSPPTGSLKPGRGAGIATRGVPAHDPIGDPLGVMVADDHLETETDIDRTTRIVSLRREVTDVLNAISRWVMEERPVTKALPDGLSALSMSLFLDRHAEWIAANDDGYEKDRLAELARRVRTVAAPGRRETVYLGDCPFVYEVQEARAEPLMLIGRPCGGKVRSRIGGDGTARCSGCGQEQEIAWWEDVLGIGWAPVTLPKLPHILHDRLHITVTDRTLRNWRRDGLITPYVEPFGPVPQWDRFDPHVVLDQVARLGRFCVMCGQPWHGYADVCNRCYVTMPTDPQRARPKRRTPAAVSLTGYCPWPRNVVPDSHDTDRPDRCHYSDLPVNQCACGRHTERSSA